MNCLRSDRLVAAFRRVPSRWGGPGLAALCLMLVGYSGARGQMVGIEARPLMRTTLSGDTTKEVVVLDARFAPGGTTGRHLHPGDEYATVVEGELELHRDGEPVRIVRAGEAYHNARDVVHETRNNGTGPARIVTTFVVDRGKPITEPIPK